MCSSDLKFIVESFQESPVTARVITAARITKLRDLVTGQEVSGRSQSAGGFGGRGGQPATVFEVPLTRGSYRVFAGN